MINPIFMEILHVNLGWKRGRNIVAKNNFLSHKNLPCLL